jgi:hypothetical protein
MYYSAIITSVMMPRDDPGETNRPCVKGDVTPVEPFVERMQPLFLGSSEIVHSKCDTLQFRVFIRILEIHDFNLPSDSKGDSSSGQDSSEEDYLGYDPVIGSCSHGHGYAGWL